MAATAPQPQPAEYGYVFKPLQLGAATRAVACRQDHRFLARQTPGHHIEEAADAGSQNGGNDGENDGQVGLHYGCRSPQGRGAGCFGIRRRGP